MFTFWPHKWILLQIREEEEGGSTEADWRFAAMVVKSACRVDGVALLCSGDRPVVPDSLHCVHPARHRGGPLHRAPCHRRLNRPPLHFSPQPASPSLHCCQTVSQQSRKTFMTTFMILHECFERHSHSFYHQASK